MKENEALKKGLGRTSEINLSCSSQLLSVIEENEALKKENEWIAKVANRHTKTAKKEEKEPDA